MFQYNNKHISFIWLKLSRARTASPSRPPEFIPGVLLGSCYSNFSFICMFCRSLFVLLYFFFWPLCCLFFFDIRIQIAPLVSANSSLVTKRNDTEYSKVNITYM